MAIKTAPKAEKAKPKQAVPKPAAKAPEAAEKLAKPAVPKAKPKAKAKPKRKPAAKTAKPAAPKPQAKPEQAENRQDRTGERKLNDPARVIAILRHCAGIKSAAAEKLNVSRQTLYTFLEEHPEVQDELDSVDEELKDIAEAAIVKALQASDMQTVRWYMELKGKDRGYVRRVENTGKDGGAIETVTKPDLTGFTDEELDILIAAQKRRESGKKG